MYQRWIRYGKPMIHELALLTLNLSVFPSHLVVAAAAGATVGIAAAALHAAVSAIALLGLAVGFAAGLGSAVFFGLRILIDIENDYGPGSAAKVVAWQRNTTKAFEGEPADLDTIIGHPPRDVD